MSHRDGTPCIIVLGTCNITIEACKIEQNIEAALSYSHSALQKILTTCSIENSN